MKASPEKSGSAGSHRDDTPGTKWTSLEVLDRKVDGLRATRIKSQRGSPDRGQRAPANKVLHQWRLAGQATISARVPDLAGNRRHGRVMS